MEALQIFLTTIVLIVIMIVGSALGVILIPLAIIGSIILLATFLVMGFQDIKD